MMLRPFQPPALLGAVLMCAACSLLNGCSNDLEVRGATERVIGETITLALVADGDDFSGDLALVDASSQRFDAAAVQLSVLGPKELSFIVPPGVSAGTAQALAFHGATAYEVPISINRLLLAMDADGRVDILSLAPGTLEPSNIPAPDQSAGAVRRLALSADGRLAATLTGTDLRIFRLAPKPAEQSAISAPEARMMALWGTGAISATAGGVEVYEHEQGQALKLRAQLTIPNQTIKAISITDDGTFAALLTHCPQLSTTSDCVARIDLAKTPPALRDTTVLDNGGDATVVALEGTGQRVLAAGPSSIDGITYTGAVGVVEQVHRANGNGQPVALERRATVISGEARDLFALATAGGVVHFLGFDQGALRDVREVAVGAPIDTISFGRGTDVIALSGTDIYRLVAAGAQLEKLGQTLNTKAMAFAVQP